MSVSPETSPTLLRELCNPSNNEAAWRTFLERYQPLIEAWGRRCGLQPADCDEVCSRLLATLVQALKTFRYDPSHRFRAWLKVVVQNAVVSYWREQARRPGIRGSGDSENLAALAQLAEPASVEDLTQSLDRGVQSEHQRACQIVERVRQRVEDRTWRAYWLTAIEERPAAEVAAELGLPIASVYVAKNRVGKHLREEAEAVAKAEPKQGASR